MTQLLTEKYLTWQWTREGFLVLSGVVASVGWLVYNNHPDKPPRVWVDEDCLSDPHSLDTLRGKSVGIDHTTREISPLNIALAEVGRVSKVWYEPTTKELRCSVLITNRQLLTLLQANPKIKIGLSPFYNSGLVMKNGKLTQVNRYYNNLSLLFLTSPRGERSYVFADSKDTKKMTELEQIKQNLVGMMAQIDAALIGQSTATTITSADSTDSSEDPYTSGYTKGLEDGTAFGEALAYADSLDIKVNPGDSLGQILEKVATKVTGKPVKAGESPAFYKGMITGNVSVFSDSTTVNPRKVTNINSAVEKANAAQQKMLASRYPEKAAKPA